jgi:quinol monooxygenase YgiN
MNTEAVTILIEIHAKPGQEQEARDALTRAIATTAKPGMVSAEIFADERDPGAFYSTQLWENTDFFKTHMGEVRGGMAEATSMLREPPRTTILKQIA